VDAAQSQPDDLAEEIVKTILGRDYAYEEPDGSER
jgi:hypothetical protein